MWLDSDGAWVSYSSCPPTLVHVDESGHHVLLVRISRWQWLDNPEETLDDSSWNPIRHIHWCTRLLSTYAIVIVCLCIIIIIVCLCVVDVVHPCIVIVHPCVIVEVGQRLNNDCGRWWLVVAVVMKRRWSRWWWCGGGWEGNSLFVDAFSCHYLVLIKNIKQVNIF